MTFNQPPASQEDGYRYVLPKRSHPFQRFLTSRCIVEATPRELRVFESFGPIKQNWARGWNRQALFTVEDQGHGSQETWALRVDLEGESVLIGTGYPKDKLKELEANLRSARQQWMGSDAAPKEFPVPESQTAQPVQPAQPTQPTQPEQPEQPGQPEQQAPSPTAQGGSAIDIQTVPLGVQIDIPPVGLGKGTHGMAVFGMLVVLLPLPFLVMSVGRAVFGNGIAELLDALPGLLGFGVLAAAVILPILNVGTRSAVITVDRRTLSILRRSMFGDKKSSYPRAKVTDVRMGNSTVQVNGKFIQELHVLVNDQKVVNMMFERTDDEIERTAQALLAALSTPADDAE